MRALVMTNMYPTPEHPERGRFVMDQVEALQRIDGIQIEVFAFPGGAKEYLKAAYRARKRFKARDFDIVHAHFGLTAWPSLAFTLGRTPLVVTLHGTDLHHPRSGPVTRTALRFADLAAAVSTSLTELLPSNSFKKKTVVLPCGIDMDRFRPIPRDTARKQLGLDPMKKYLLFPADPKREVKRYDRAAEVASSLGIQLLTLGGVNPKEVPYWINSANSVIVTSEAEGFGLATLEALACNVPVLSTPVGIASLALNGIEGTLCSNFDKTRWIELLKKHLASEDPRVEGREKAELFSANRMAERVAVAWQELSSKVSASR